VDQKNITNFSQVWNEFIYSMRSEDKISDRLDSFLLESNLVIIVLFCLASIYVM